MRTTNTSILLTLTLAACGGGSTVSEPPPTNAPGPSGTPVNSTPGLDVGGVWALRIISAQIINAPIVGAQHSKITTLGRATITQNGIAAQAAIEICKIYLDPVGGVTTNYPLTAVHSLVPENMSITMSDNSVGGSFVGQPASELLGWMSQDPANDALPANAQDPRVFDQDGDGHPGVTLQASGLVSGDLYIVNRTTIGLSGKIMAADHIAGLDDTSFNQVVLGATDNLIPTGPIDAMKDPNADSSTFALMRLGQSGNGCGDINAGESMIFR
jgi:hypothetical protein